ncbi:hypothetical protein P7C70_g5452, partial [Phenoliferia sp. Uapishka_3]
MDGTENKRRADTVLPLGDTTNIKRTRLGLSPVKTTAPAILPTIPNSAPPPTSPAIQTPTVALVAEVPVIEEDSIVKEVETTAEDLLYDLRNIFEPLQVDRPPFAESRVLDGAPIPGIFIEGVGRVESASERDAEVLKGQAVDASEHVTHNQHVEQTSWELLASIVAFKNAAWTTYVQGTLLPQACKDLSVSSSTTQISFVKILLQGPSASLSTLIDVKDLELTANAFAWVAIDLPSAWDGGITEIVLGSESVGFRPSKDQEFIPSCVAWHASTSLSRSPLTSGHRFTLIYSLSHNSADTPIPTIVNPASQEASLSATLSDWLEALDGEDFDLEQAVIMLSAQTPVNFATFQGADKVNVDLVRRAAKKLGFDVFLAEVSATREGECEDCQCVGEIEARNEERQQRRYAQEDSGVSYRHEKRRFGSRFGYYDDEDESEVSSDEEIDNGGCECEREISDPDSADTTIEIVALTSEDGQAHEVTHFPLELEQLVGTPFEGEPESKDFSSASNELTETFTRYALVLWPTENRDTILMACLGITTLASQLDHSVGKFLDAETKTNDVKNSEKARVRSLFNAVYFSHDRSAANFAVWFQRLLGASFALQNPELFTRFVGVSSSHVTMASLSSSGIAKAVEIFGEAPVVPLLEAMLSSSQLNTSSRPSIAQHFLFVQQTVNRCPTLTPYIGKLYAAALSTRTDLGTSTNLPDVVGLIIRLGTVTFQREILPVLEKQMDARTHLGLVQVFLGEAKKLSGEEAATCRKFATNVLSTQVARYQPTVTEKAVHSTAFSVGVAMDLVTAALDFDRLDLIKVVLDKAVAPVSAPYITHALQPFLITLKASLAKRPEGLYTFDDEPFREFAFRLITRQVATFQANSTSIGHPPAHQYGYNHSYGVPAAPLPRTSDFWKLFLVVLDTGVAASTHLDQLLSRLLVPAPPVTSNYFSTSLHALWTEMHAELRSRGAFELLNTNHFQMFGAALLRKAFETHFASWSTRPLNESSLAAAHESLRFAVESRSLDTISLLIRHIAPAPMFTVALPFCTRATQLFLVDPTMATAPWAEPLRQFFTTTFATALAGVGRGPALADQSSMLKIGCGCANCKDLESFLTSSRQQSWSLRGLLKQRQHIVERTRLKRAAGLNLTVETIKNRTPHTLQLTKPAKWGWDAVVAWKVKYDPLQQFASKLADARLLRPFGLDAAAAEHLNVVEM